MNAHDPTESKEITLPAGASDSINSIESLTDETNIIPTQSSSSLSSSSSSTDSQIIRRFFRAPELQSVTNKPLSLEVRIRLKQITNGNHNTMESIQVVAKLAIKISAGAVLKKSNSYQELERVYVTTEMNSTDLTPTNEDGKDRQIGSEEIRTKQPERNETSKCATLAGLAESCFLTYSPVELDGSRGLLTYIQTLGGMTAMRPKQRYILIESGCWYELEMSERTQGFQVESISAQIRSWIFENTKLELYDALPSNPSAGTKKVRNRAGTGSAAAIFNQPATGESTDLKQKNSFSCPSTTGKSTELSILKERNHRIHPQLQSSPLQDEVIQTNSSSASSQEVLLMQDTIPITDPALNHRAGQKRLSELLTTREAKRARKAEKVDARLVDTEPARRGRSFEKLCQIAGINLSSNQPELGSVVSLCRPALNRSKSMTSAFTLIEVASGMAEQVSSASQTMDSAGSKKKEKHSFVRVTGSKIKIKRSKMNQAATSTQIQMEGAMVTSAPIPGVRIPIPVPAKLPIRRTLFTQVADHTNEEKSNTTSAELMGIVPVAPLHNVQTAPTMMDQPPAAARATVQSISSDRRSITPTMMMEPCATGSTTYFSSGTSYSSARSSPMNETMQGITIHPYMLTPSATNGYDWHTTHLHDIQSTYCSNSSCLFQNSRSSMSGAMYAPSHSSSHFGSPYQPYVRIPTPTTMSPLISSSTYGSPRISCSATLPPSSISRPHPCAPPFTRPAANVGGMLAFERPQSSLLSPPISIPRSSPMPLSEYRI